MKNKLIEAIDQAHADFTEAKAHAIKELQTMTIHEAVDFGAGYAAKIDQVTATAQKLKNLYHILSMYNYYHPES